MTPTQLIERRAKHCVSQVLHRHLHAAASELHPQSSYCTAELVQHMAVACNGLVDELYQDGGTAEQNCEAWAAIRRQWTECAATIVQQVARQYRHSLPRNR